MTCSARSLASARSSFSSARSSSRVAPRGRVPASGIVSHVASAGAGGDAHETLGRRAEDRAVRRAQVVLVRRRADGAQRAIDGEGIAVERRGPAPREDDLEDVARPDVLLRASRPRQERRKRKRFFERKRPGRSRRAAARASRWRGPRAPLTFRGLFSPRPSLPRVRHEEQAMPHVVERDDRVEEAEPRVGHPDRIGFVSGSRSRRRTAS